MKLLAVDSSSVTASVSVIEDEKILAEFFINAGLTHSQTLAPMIDEIIKNLNLKVKDIDVFAVTHGPGSFTGLRIGMATVKGMALALNKPCIGVSSLFAASCNFRDFKGIIAACMDARRGEIYNAIFNSDGASVATLIKDRTISIEKLANEFKNYNCKIKLVGDGAEMCYNVLVQDYHLNKIELSLESQRYVRASQVGLAALQIYKEGNSISAVDINPKYLRVSQAERVLLKNKLLGENL